VETLKLEFVQFLSFSLKALPVWKLQDQSSGQNPVVVTFSCMDGGRPGQQDERCTLLHRNSGHTKRVVNLLLTVEAWGGGG